MKKVPWNCKHCDNLFKNTKSTSLHSQSTIPAGMSLHWIFVFPHLPKVGGKMCSGMSAIIAISCTLHITNQVALGFFWSILFHTRRCGLATTTSTLEGGVGQGFVGSTVNIYGWWWCIGHVIPPAIIHLPTTHTSVGQTKLPWLPMRQLSLTCLVKFHHGRKKAIS